MLSFASRVATRTFSAAAVQVPPMPATKFVPKPYTGPSKAEIEEMRGKHLHPTCVPMYKKPLLTVEGKMQYLWDEEGTRYLDFFGGIVTISVGHAHPEVTQAATEQFETLGHTTSIYHSVPQALYAKELLAKMPEHITRVYFVNSGSEANDLAISMARNFTHNTNVIGIRNGYHGMSLATSEVTAFSTWRQNNNRYPGGVLHTLQPNKYRGLVGDDLDKYLEDLKQIVFHQTPGQVAAFIAEPIQGWGGTYEYLPGYLSKAYEIIRAAGGVCIADEVQTGFARTGTHFWGFEREGVSPDIVCMAKSIGNGIPLAAVCCTEEVAQAFTGKLHFNTYGGNHISMAVGRKVLEIIERDNLQEHCLQMGHILLAGLNKMMDKYDCVGDVRGSGLLLGLEFVKDRNTKEVDPEMCASVLEICKDNGLLLGKGGPYGNIFRIKPPMCITEEDAHFALGVIEYAIQQSMKN